MIYRKGSYGLFWGCRNYSGNDELSCKYTINNIKTPKGYKDILDITNNTKQKSSVKESNVIQEVWDDKKFTVRTDAYEYAKKLAMTKKSTVNVIEKDGYWLVELKNR